MKRFLTRAAEKIIAGNYLGPKSVIILPNRRSEVFLKEEIKKINHSNIWLPEFYPIDEFIQKVAGMRKADNTTISFELYSVYSKVEGKSAKSIEDFLTWAPVILSDFSDIDNSMVDAKDIYEQLSAIKAIQQWNPDGRPLTELQRNYLHFFNSMFEYYTGLTESLKGKEIGYQGLISRFLVENILEYSSNMIWDNYLIVGINALSEAELQIINHINKNSKTEFVWDLDQYYYNDNTDKSNNHEAGKHIKHIINKLKIDPPKLVENHLATAKKTIRTLGVPKNIGQAKFIGQELRLNSENLIQKASENSHSQNTAIILANEELLVPLLHSLPKTTSDQNIPIPYNLTLGYPLSNSHIDHFFSNWIDVIISTTRNNQSLTTPDLITLFNNPIVKQIFSTENVITEQIIKHLITKNISNIRFDELENLFSKYGSIPHFQTLNLLLNSKNTHSILSSLEGLKSTLVSIVDKSKTANLLFQEEIKSLIHIVTQLIELTRDNINIINYPALKKIGKQLISQSTINLVGEPLHGIQIMGMLETRTLDFDNIYILSVNEGTLPSAKNIDSFIPMDIRQEIGLPLPSDKSDIYAYHFYRLLQRAKNINLIYNSDTDKLGSGEKSRFILQIENELNKVNPNIELINNVIITEIKNSEPKESKSSIIEVKKDSIILNKISDISDSGYSASLFNNFITCPLKFYFSQILRLKTSTSLEQSVEPNTFGTVIHAVLEDIYKPFTGKEIDIIEIKKSLKNVRLLLSLKFKEYYSNGNISSGKNLLTFEVAVNYITNFLKWDIKNIHNNPSILLSTEVKIINELDLGNGKINFKGVIDRIDKRVSDGRIRIIDYKTGKVENKDLKVKNTDDLTNNPSFSKAFQVSYYAWLLAEQYKDQEIETGIISTRSLSNGFIPLVLQEYDNISEYLDEFTESINQMVCKISDPDTSFTQTTDLNICEWCDYKSICNR